MSPENKITTYWTVGFVAVVVVAAVVAWALGAFDMPAPVTQ